MVTNHAENRISESVSEIKTERSRASGDRAARVVSNHASPPKRGQSFDWPCDDPDLPETLAKIFF